MFLSGPVDKLVLKIIRDDSLYTLWLLMVCYAISQYKKKHNYVWRGEETIGTTTTTTPQIEWFNTSWLLLIEGKFQFFYLILCSSWWTVILTWRALPVTDKEKDLAEAFGDSLRLEKHPERVPAVYVLPTFWVSEPLPALRTGMAPDTHIPLKTLPPSPAPADSPSTFLGTKRLICSWGRRMSFWKYYLKTTWSTQKITTVPVAWEMESEEFWRDLGRLKMSSPGPGWDQQFSLLASTHHPILASAQHREEVRKYLWINTWQPEDTNIKLLLSIHCFGFFVSELLPRTRLRNQQLLYHHSLDTPPFHLTSSPQRIWGFPFALRQWDTVRNLFESLSGWEDSFK